LTGINTLGKISTIVNMSDSTKGDVVPSSATSSVRPASVGCCIPATGSPALDEAQATELASTFRVLADPSRLRLLSLVASAPNGEACACDLVGPVGRSQPTVSHHLAMLVEAGLLTRDKRGRWAWYSVVPGRLEELRSALAP
jgi:ArsR family transcriptional regulator, arsenate/arsenite/antimonite-responsive transcriptional repressor